MQANGLILLDEAPQALSIPNGASGSARWTAVASRVGTSLVTSTVSLPTHGDRVELPFHTKPFAVPERQYASGRVMAEEPTVSEEFTVPVNAVNELTELKLYLSPSIALSLVDGLDSLIGYPYGCVEQTMSRLLPTAAAAKVYADLGIPNPKAEELPKMINRGLQTLYSYQHSNGGWGWFYDDQGSSYLTAYVLYGLQTVKEAGFEVSPGRDG